jgi:hypothetical protein
MIFPSGTRYTRPTTSISCNASDPLCSCALPSSWQRVSIVHENHWVQLIGNLINSWAWTVGRWLTSFRPNHQTYSACTLLQDYYCYHFDSKSIKIPNDYAGPAIVIRSEPVLLFRIKIFHLFKESLNSWKMRILNAIDPF